MKKTLLLLLGLSIIGTIPLLDLLTRGMFVAHDSLDHVARIANFYQSLSEGIIVPRWAGNLNWGFGHPILMFLYPLPSYVASGFRALGFSFTDSAKLVFAVSYLSGMLAMFWWLRAWLGTLPGFVGAVLYGFAPYRFVDLYVRGAIGEHMAFTFAPLICLGLYKLALNNERRMSAWRGLLALSTAGLILSHNALSLMFLTVVALYGLYLLLFVAKRKLSFFIGAIFFVLLGFGLSAFFWIPAFYEGKYTLRDIVTKGEFGTRFVAFPSFLYSPWKYGGGEFTKQIGVIHWVGLLATIWVFFRRKQSHMRWLIAGCWAVFAVAIFLMTYPSLPIWNTVILLQKFQFPWRLLSVVVFTTSVTGAIVMTSLPKQYTKAGILIVAVAVAATFTMWHAREYTIKSESYYSGIYDSTTDTGESSPIWSVRFMEKRAKAPMEVIDGKADIALRFRTSTSHSYQVVARTKTRLVENTLYFPGWTVSVDGKRLDTAQIIFQDPDYRGLMTFFVEPGDHTVLISFGETKLRKVANALSVASMGFLLCVFSIQLFRRYV